jgi:hypothetical protein
MLKIFTILILFTISIHSFAQADNSKYDSSAALPEYLKYHDKIVKKQF